MPTFPNGALLGTVRAILNNTGLVKNTYGAIAAPQPSDDSGDGYEKGSLWQAGAQVWMCIDPGAGAAVWIDISATGEGGVPGEVVTGIYQTRALAQNSTIPVDITRIIVAGMAYRADPFGMALISTGNRRWSPDGVVTPMHFGAVGDGVENDRAAVQAAINHLVLTSDSKPDAFTNSPAAVLSGAGRQYAINGPVFIGNIGDGSGMMYHAKVESLKLKAVEGTWSGNIVAGVPRQMLVVAWRLDINYTDTGAGIFNNVLGNITLDCNYLTGGIYFENTNSCTFTQSRIGRVGKGRTGYLTGASRQYTGHPTGFYIGNGALSVENLNIGGLEEEVDESFPAGEDQVSMNTIGMSHQSNDARINNVVISRVSKAAVFDNCGAVQVSNFHPWSKDVEIGANANNLQFVNAYFDYSNVRVIGNHNHLFVGCAWPLGTAAAGNGLWLVATLPNSTADGLVVAGCKFRGDQTINWTTEGTGTWVAERARKATITGCSFETAPPAWQTVVAGSQSFIGPVWLGPVIETVGVQSGTTIVPANGTLQTRTLTAAVTLTANLSSWAEGQTVVVQWTNGDANAVTHPGAWLPDKGMPPTWAKVQEIVYTRVGGVIRYGAGRGYAA